MPGRWNRVQGSVLLQGPISFGVCWRVLTYGSLPSHGGSRALGHDFADEAAVFPAAVAADHPSGRHCDTDRLPVRVRRALGAPQVHSTAGPPLCRELLGDVLSPQFGVFVLKGAHHLHAPGIIQHHHFDAA